MNRSLKSLLNIKDNIRLNIYSKVEMKAAERGIDKKRAIFKLEQAEEILGISPKEYYKNGYYNYTNYCLVQKLCAPTREDVLRKIYEIIRMRLGVSLEEARANVSHIENRFGITPQSIMRLGLYKCTDEQISVRLERGGYETI